MQWVYLKGRKRAVYKFLRGGLVLALGWARPGGLWISLCLHIGSWCCSERLDCARTPPWEPSWGRNGPHGPEPLDFIVLALGCSKNRPAQGGGAGLLIYSQNRWPRTPITYKKKHCRCSVFCTYTKHYRWPRTPITYTTGGYVGLLMLIVWSAYLGFGCCYSSLT